MAYDELILQAFFVADEVLPLDVIIERINKPRTKMTYVINAIKKLIKLNKLEQIKVSGQKRLYVGHLYRLKIDV